MSTRKTTILLRWVAWREKRKPPLARASDQWGQRKGGKERQSKRGYASYAFIYHFTPLSGQRQSDKGMVFLLIFWMGMPKKFL